MTAEEIKSRDWIGVVENNKDPIFSGRCQVRVFKLMDGIPTESLPWSLPINSGVFSTSGAGSISIPKIGSFVRINFSSGDIYSPEYFAIQNVDPDLIQRIRDDYEGTHVLLYDSDEELNIIYQKEAGFQIFFKESFIQITPNSMITIQHAGGDSIIQLEGDKCNIVTKNEINISAAAKVAVSADEVVVAGANTTKIGPGPYQHAVLAETLFPLLQTLATAIDAKLPATPGVSVSIVNSAKEAGSSGNVLIGI